MKKFLMCLLAVMFVLASGDALAAKDSKDKSKAKSKTRSVAGKVQAGKAVWKTDIKAAIAEAQKSNKQILVLLTGSDWCGYCMKLDKAVFSHKSFPALAKNLVLVKADFPRKKLSPELQKQANEVKMMFPANGFPTVYLLDPNGKVLDKQVGFGGGTPGSYMKRFKGYKEPKASKKKKK